MTTFAQELETLRAQAVTFAETTATLTAAVETHKLEAQAAVAALGQRDLEHTATVEKLTAELLAVTTASDELAGQVVEANAKVAQLEGKLALVPAMADVSTGVPPVADGSTAGEAKDWIAENEKRTGADRLTFYRANKATIDAAYIRKNRK